MLGGKQKAHVTLVFSLLQEPTKINKERKRRGQAFLFEAAN